jgi:ABC-type transport system involved in multi-copper enzyme maturation permease subunit
MVVHDLTYRRGVARAARGPRWLPIASECFSYALRNRWMKLLFGLCWLPPLGAVFTLYFVRQVLAGVGAEVSAGMLSFDLDKYEIFYANAWIPLVLLAAGAGSGLISADLRAHALELVFSRAVTRADYLLGKILGMVGVLLAATALPWTLVWLFDIGLSESSDRFFATWHYPLRLIANAVVFAVPTTLIVLAISALAGRGLWAILYWIALAIITRPVGVVAANSLFRDTRAGVLSFIDTFNSLRYAIFDIPRNPLASMVAPPTEVAAWAVLLASALALRILIRRTNPTEVVA